MFERSHEVEFIVHLGESFFGEALFVGRVWLGEPGFKGRLLGQEAFASDAAGEHSGQGVKEAEGVEWVLLKSALEGVGTEIDESLAGEGDSDFGSGLIGFGAWMVGGQVLEELGSSAAVIAALLFRQEIGETAV